MEKTDEPRVCRRCGEPIPADAKWYKKYCTGRCRHLASLARERARDKAHLAAKAARASEAAQQP